MKAFFTSIDTHQWEAAYLPVLSALYESLVDDDDEVREAAASAASAIIGTPVIAPTAADILVPWLAERFGEVEELASRVVCRMVGQQYSQDFQLVPAEVQLGKAMDFDDSLFAAEDQNLFIDEVRETGRWRGALEGLKRSGSRGSLGCLKTWVEAGLKSLIGLVKTEDGPLGWTSDQHVFAVCARILICAVAVTKTGEGAGIDELLREFRAAGENAGIHGSLLEMARLEMVA